MALENIEFLFCYLCTKVPGPDKITFLAKRPRVCLEKKSFGTKKSHIYYCSIAMAIGQGLYLLPRR